MLRVFTSFSGYDSQCLALDRLGIEYELVGWSEIDKYAIQAHNALYPQWADRNYGDISKIDWGGRKCLILTYLRIHRLAKILAKPVFSVEAQREAEHDHPSYGSARRPSPSNGLNFC